MVLEFHKNFPANLKVIFSKNSSYTANSSFTNSNFKRWQLAKYFINNDILQNILQKGGIWPFWPANESKRAASYSEKEHESVSKKKKNGRE